MKSVENPKLSSGNLKMLKHKSAEGGQDTVGYGHKLTDKEIKNNPYYNMTFVIHQSHSRKELFDIIAQVKLPIKGKHEKNKKQLLLMVIEF